MRRSLVCREFRLHDVAALAAELNRFHMLHSPVGPLSGDDDIGSRCEGEKNHNAPYGCRAVQYGSKPFPCAASSEIDANGDQRKAQAKEQRDGDKNNQADIGIAGVTPNLHRQHGQPGEAGSSDQRRPEQAQPMTGQEFKNRSVRLRANCLFIHI